MIAVEISKATDADLEAIYDYGADRFGDEVAARYLRGFDEAFALIAEHPLIGALDDAVRPPINGLSLAAIASTMTCSRIARSCSASFTRQWTWSATCRPAILPP